MNNTNLSDYGFSSHLLPESSSGIPARITSVHKERFGLICEYGEIYGRLKTKEYYIILTKADLVDDPGEHIDAVKQVAPGVAIHAVSVMTGYGLVALEPYLRPGRTIVFLGSSGIGKSSLVNALAGENIMAVNTIREDDSKGRHTTTHRQLLMFPSGAMVIDTPGMRELGMWDVSDGLSNAFTDVEQFLSKCRFRDCTHQAEPGCAIKAAIKNGELSAARWKSYCALEKEARYADDKADFMRQKQQWHKTLSKGQKQKKKEIW